MSEIGSGDLALGLVPEIGGSVAYFRKGGADLMRPLSEADRARGDVLGVAMFPMIPYANRIADNQFSFDGRTYRFAQNNPPERFNVHGTAWKLPWTERRIAADELMLELAHVAPDEPYSYAAWQHFRLYPDRLVVETAVENRGARRMPFGFGQHPWFMPDRDTTLRFDAGTVWLFGADILTTERLRPPPEFDFSKGATLPPVWRAFCYSEWPGTAEIRWPSRKLGLRVDADPVFKHLVLYSNPRAGALCLEPQTNAVSAFTAPGEDLGGYDLGVIVLEPGERASGTVTFTPFVLG
jgi:aldose 1-epimerase